MTMVELSFDIFLIFSVIRLLAYGPQIVKIAQDRTGAAVISNATWGLFAASHFATALYSHSALGDFWITITFLANGIGCWLVVAVTLYKRRRFGSPAMGRGAAVSA